MPNQKITIGGILYPSQDWYDKNITAKGRLKNRRIEIEIILTSD